MTGRRVVIGLSLLCALALSAFAAPSAFAERGQTAFTCAKEEGVRNFEDPHCDKTATGTGEYGHVAITEKTNISLTNHNTKNNTTEHTPAFLHAAKLHGVANVEIECTTVHGTGTMENKVEGVMRATGEGTIEFEGNPRLVPPTDTGNCWTNQSGCTVKPGKVETKAKTIETAAVGGMEAGMGLEFSPKTGTKFTTVTFEGSCGLKSFGAIPVEGSVVGTAEGVPNGMGATISFANTGLGNLKVGGEPAELTGTATIVGPNGNALTATTE
jgi:hypothetical protein